MIAKQSGGVLPEPGGFSDTTGDAAEADAIDRRRAHCDGDASRFISG